MTPSVVTPETEAICAQILAIIADVESEYAQRRAQIDAVLPRPSKARRAPSAAAQLAALALSSLGRAARVM